VLQCVFPHVLGIHMREEMDAFGGKQ
jgi:hypothetical protein